MKLEVWRGGGGCRGRGGGGEIFYIEEEEEEAMECFSFSGLQPHSLLTNIVTDCLAAVSRSYLLRNANSGTKDTSNLDQHATDSLSL